MKIVALTVTAEDGTVHAWEGLTGHVHVGTVSAKGQPYQRAVDAHLLLPSDPRVKA